MKMSHFKKNGIMSFKTYGKQKQKSEKWILPDRKAIFSSSSSDMSYSFEEKYPTRVKRRKKASTVKFIKPKDNGKLQAGGILRVKNREKDLAKEVILLSSSGKENQTYSSGLTVIDKSVGKNDNSPSKQDFPVGVAQKIVNFSKRRLRSCRVKDARLPRSAKQKALDQIKMSSGFDDMKTDVEETFPRSKEIKDVEKVIQSDSSVFVPPTPLQRFVTRRRKIVKHNKTAANKCPQDSKFKTSISHFQRSSMKGSIPTYIQKNTSNFPLNLSSENSGEVCSFQREENKDILDLNKTRFKSPIDRPLTKRAFKRPVVCSTPSVVLKSGQQLYEPSLSDISFGNDENESMKSNGNMNHRQRNNLKNTGHIIYPEEQSPASLLRSTKSVLEIISQNGHCGFSNISQISKELFSDISSSFIESQSERVQLEEKTDRCDNHGPLGCEKYLESHLDLASNFKSRLSASEPVVCFERGDKCTLIEKNALQPVIMLEKLDKSQLTINQKEMSSKSLKTQHEFRSRSSTEHLYSVIEGSVDDLLLSNEKSNVHLPLPASTSAQELKAQSTITVSSQVVKSNEKLRLEMDHLPISLQHNPDTSDFVNSGNYMQDVNMIKKRCLSLQPVVLLEYASIPPYLIKQNVGCEQELQSRQYRISGYIEKQQDVSKMDQMALTNSSIMNNLSGFNSLISEEPFIDYTGDPVNSESLERNLATKFIKSSSRNLAACKRLTAQHPISALNTSQHTNMGSSLVDSCSFQVSNYLSSSKLEKIAPEDVLKEVPKEKTKTVRKVCVSGFSANRWSKNDRKKKSKKTWKSNVSSASNANFSLTDFGLKKYQKKSNYETTLGDCFLNIKDVSLMATPKNFSFQTLLNTHSWSRLKAALSIHKKKIAVFTPKKLNLSCPDTTTNFLRTNLDLTAESLNHFSGNVSLLNSPNSMCDISDAEKVYHECKQEGPLSFEDCLSSNKLKQCKKIGEGAFGEVFCTTNNNDELVALKIIPIEGKDIVNGENQKMFGEILHEIIISKELSSLKERKHNRSDGFITLHSLHCVKGSYPEPLLKAWDAFDKERQSENDRPDFFGNDQLFLVLEFEFGGSDLENMQKKLPSLITAKSILHQVTAALAVAEQAFCFEHRDLHWGNILVKKTNNVKEEYMLNGTKRNLITHGYHVNLIDYSLSRLEIDGLTVSCDISSDEALFMGQGDYQFDIYRKMREENNNSWSEYHPHSNVLWLHYLTDKLLHLNYKTKARTSALRALKKSIEQFYQDVLKYESAMDVLQHSSLFQESQ